MKIRRNISNQNKLIITALVISTLLIVLSALLGITKVKSELDKSYRTISYITFKNIKGDIVYSTQNKQEESDNDTKVTTLIVDKNGNHAGSVVVGLNNNVAKNITQTTKKSILVVFSIIWLVFTFVIIVNSILIKRELIILHHGVKAIEKGKFGTLLNYNQTSGEVKDLYDAFNKMSKKLHSYEEQNIDTITLERNKLEAVLMSIANGVVVCDSFDNITMINYAAQKILDNDESLLGTTIESYRDSKGSYCFEQNISIFKNTPLEIMERKPLECNIEINDSVIKALISPTYSKNHDYLGYIIVLIDMTKEAEVDRLKSAFISNVSHELRTPVTILSSYADTLYTCADELSVEEQKDFIATINQEVVRLNDMVNDILDFSRLQTNLELEKEKGNITETISKIIKSHKILADKKNIEIEFNYEDNLPEISYNEQSIERVISNLLTNAIKYSKQNSKVEVNALKDDSYLKVTVKDNGIGIEKKYFDKIFERFYRIENQVHTIKGTGLGLHLVKVAIENHHQGKVFVDSKLNEGSTFGFMLPLDV